jgi:hypothetical protein
MGQLFTVLYFIYLCFFITFINWYNTGGYILIHFYYESYYSLIYNYYKKYIVNASVQACYQYMKDSYKANMAFAKVARKMFKKERARRKRYEEKIDRLIERNIARYGPAREAEEKKLLDEMKIEGLFTYRDYWDDKDGYFLYYFFSNRKFYFKNVSFFTAVLYTWSCC